VWLDSEGIMTDDDEDEEFQDPDEQPEWREPADKRFEKRVKRVFTKVTEESTQRTKEAIKEAIQRLSEQIDRDHQASAESLTAFVNQWVENAWQKMNAMCKSQALEFIDLFERLEGQVEYLDKQGQESAERERLLTARVEALEARLTALEAQKLPR
jgi:hypothetical protein